MDWMYIVGVATVGLLGYRLLKFILTLVEFFSGEAPDLKKYGKWAIVTGCTDGIGQEYARQIAAQGVDIVLISRSLTKLQNTSTELENTYKIKTKIIAADFTNIDIYDRISKDIEGLEIGILINNVGMGIGKLDTVGETQDRDLVQNVLNCNMTSVCMMTSLVVREMADRGRGLIINISSLSAGAPVPMVAVYSSTKVFVNNYSLSVHREYADKGVEVQVILPGYVATKMPGIKTPSLFAPSPKDFVTSALKTVGKHARSAGYWCHAIQLSLADTLTYISPTLASSVFQMMMNSRRAQKQKEQEEEEKQE